MANGHALGGAPNKMEAKVASADDRFTAMEMVRFSNTGSEANTYAINTARAVTGRSKILMYEGAYHGAWIHDELALDIPYEKIVPYEDANLICQAIKDNAYLQRSSWNRDGQSMDLLKNSGASALPQADTACSEAGCALIFDEVMTSRLAPGGAQELVGVAPDLTFWQIFRQWHAFWRFWGQARVDGTP